MVPIFDRRTSASILVVIFILMAISPALAADAVDISNDLNVGPYVDKVVFKVIDDPDQKILSLLSGDIEFDTGFHTPDIIPMFLDYPDISIYTALRYGYGHITINCGKYPLNISGFRKAFAYAFDKTSVNIDIWKGYSQEHDSLVPYLNEFCIEDQLPYHYYLAQPETGNQILDDLEFYVDPVSGFRNAPDGTPFKVVIEYAITPREIAGAAAQLGVNAMHSLHVNAEMQQRPASDLINRLDNHEDYDLVFYAFNFLSNELDWLANEYWSELVDVQCFNPCNFKNQTYDSLRNRLLYSTTYEDTFEASDAMQRILHENVPRLIVYTNMYIQGYRNDVYTGHIGDKKHYLASPWTIRKIHKIDGTVGGNINIGIESWKLGSFNPFIAPNSPTVFLLWPSLYSRDPNLDPWPYIAKSCVMETHAENQAVQDGHTRFTFDLIQNATWSDGTPLTADDVAFTFNYLIESSVHGNPSSAAFGELVAAYTPSPYRVVIEFSTESYWHFYNVAFTQIIPKHIFFEPDGIGFRNWYNWNPVFDPKEPYITSGPFNFTDFEVGDFCELSVNRDFCYIPNLNTSTTSETTPTTHHGEPFNVSLALAGGAIGAAAVILVGGFILQRQRILNFER